MTTAFAVSQAAGLMVNYYYDLDAIDALFAHERQQVLHAGQGRVGVSKHPALVLQRGVGDAHAVAARPDDLRFWHAHVREEYFVEFRGACHGAKRAHVDTRSAHREDQVADAQISIGRMGFRSHQREHHVRGMRRRGPDLLTIDDEIIAVFDMNGNLMLVFF